MTEKQQKAKKVTEASELVLRVVIATALKDLQYWNDYIKVKKKLIWYVDGKSFVHASVLEKKNISLFLISDVKLKGVTFLKCYWTLLCNDQYFFGQLNHLKSLYIFILPWKLRNNLTLSYNRKQLRVNLTSAIN